MRLQKIIKGIFILTVFSLLLIYFFHPIPLDIGNSDLGRHLLLGKIIISLKTVPATNLFSYTFPEYPFINTHWLSEVVFYLIYMLGGFNGLIITSVLIIGLAFLSLFITVSKKFGIFVSAFIALIYIQILSERSQVRPELFSFLLLSIFIVVLYRYRENYTKWIFALIPLELFWVNFHIYFFVGLATVALFLIDSLVLRKDKFISKKTATLIVVTILTVLTIVCNPNFLKGAIYPFIVLNNYGLHVQENSNFFSAIQLYQDPTFFYFGISLVALWVFISISFKKFALIDILLAVFFSFMGIFAVRDFPLFVFGTFIILVKGISLAFKNYSLKIPLKILVLVQIVTFCLAFVLILPAITSNVTNNGFGLGVTDNAKDAVSFLVKNNIEGKIYNNFDLGNYLEYRLYPPEKVFVDGRPEAYPKDFFQNIYFPMRENAAVFKKESNKYNFNVIFFDHTDLANDTEQFLSHLITDKQWKIVYLNSDIGIFLKDNQINKPIIDKYSIDEKNVHINQNDLNDKNKVMQYANFFGAVGWKSKQLDMTIRYLYFYPNNCDAIRNSIYLLRQLKDPRLSNYITRYHGKCI